MKTFSWIGMAMIAASLTACEADDIYFEDFLNDMTVNMDDGDDADCGDGWLDPGEECDDGNTWDGDGCSSNCSYEDWGCYDEYGWYRYPGESWSYWENEECTCAGYGKIDCWGWDEPDPDYCEVDGMYYKTGETFEMDGNICTCLGADAVGCYADDGQEIIV